MRVRQLALMLLILVLPWQSLAAVELPTAVHDHSAAVLGLLAKIGGDAGAAQHAHRHHAAHQDHDQEGPITVQEHDPGSTDVTHSTCTNVCCSPALAASEAAPLAAANDHGWVIPCATAPLPSRPADRLERPPRSCLV